MLSRVQPASHAFHQRARPHRALPGGERAGEKVAAPAIADPFDLASMVNELPARPSSAKLFHHRHEAGGVSAARSSLAFRQRAHHRHKAEGVVDQLEKLFCVWF
jgi:hypothetical protein